MTRKTALSDTRTYDSDSGDLRAIIETPRGIRNKFRYDPECNCFELATALPEGMSFPFDFGFVPSTLGDDGDPLDLAVARHARTHEGIKTLDQLRPHTLEDASPPALRAADEARRRAQDVAR
jgi:inorganic pyrophosphatase